MTERQDAIVTIYAEIMENRGVDPLPAAIMAAAVIIAHDLDIISDILDSIDTRLLSAVTMDGDQ